MTSVPEMIVDVVDHRNRRIGNAARSDVLPQGLSFRTVHVFLFSPTGELLLQRLPANHPRSPSRLGSSVAGYLYSGETYETAARRKLWQELMLKTSISRVATWPMNDEASRKFVALFTGSVRTTPSYDTGSIAGIEYMNMDLVDSLVRDSEGFTSTFVFLYDRFRTLASR